MKRPGKSQLGSCIFRMIAKKEVPASVVYEDNQVMAFLDINPVQRGHTLVIPKSHFVDIWDIEPGVFTKVVSVVRQLAKRMGSSLEAEGINTFSARVGPMAKKSFTFTYM